MTRPSQKKKYAPSIMKNRVGLTSTRVAVSCRSGGSSSSSSSSSSSTSGSSRSHSSSSSSSYLSKYTRPDGESSKNVVSNSAHVTFSALQNQDEGQDDERTREKTETMKPKATTMAVRNKKVNSGRVSG